MRGLCLCAEAEPAVVSKYQRADGPQPQLHAHHSAHDGAHGVASAAACAQSCRLLLLSLLLVLIASIPYLPSSSTTPSTPATNKGGAVALWEPGAAGAEGWGEECIRRARALPAWPVYPSLL